MNKEGFGKLVNLEEAKRIIDHISGEMGNETKEIKDSLNRVLAIDVKAAIDVPHFRKSAMDGYAVLASDTYGATNSKPRQLRIIEHITAGKLPTKTLQEGECTQITTGACLPSNAESVIMVEYTEQEGEMLTIYKSCAPSDNTIAIGSDVKKGTVVLRKGTIIKARHIGVLAAIGVKEVSVKKIPKVATLSTGDELLQAQEALEPGKIYDINSLTIEGALREQGITIYPLGLVKDDKEQIREKILEGVKNADIVLLSGGSSLGAEDMTKEIITELGKVHVSGIAVKPGKPVIIGEIDKKPILGLPGYPASALSNHYILVAPVLDKMQGAHRTLVYETARLSRKVASTIGRYEFLAVHVENGVATPIMKGSSSITTLSEANGFLEIDENTEVLEKDAIVMVRRFE